MRARSTRAGEGWPTPSCTVTATPHPTHLARVTAVAARLNGSVARPRPPDCVCCVLGGCAVGTGRGPRAHTRDHVHGQGRAGDARAPDQGGHARRRQARRRGRMHACCMGHARMGNRGGVWTPSMPLRPHVRARVPQGRDRVHLPRVLLHAGQAPLQGAGGGSGGPWTAALRSGLRLCRMRTHAHARRPRQALGFDERPNVWIGAEVKEAVRMAIRCAPRHQTAQARFQQARLAAQQTQLPNPHPPAPAGTRARSRRAPTWPRCWTSQTLGPPPGRTSRTQSRRSARGCTQSAGTRFGTAFSTGCARHASTWDCA